MLEYSLLSRVLHHLALAHPFLLETAFDIEWWTQREECPSSLDCAHVFIAGLARAGTTVLMRTLYGTGEFGSLTYRDMPFVLSPNLWARIAETSKQHVEAIGRAHGDGMKVDFDSPEAFEEVFWRVFSGKAYIREDRLIPMAADEEVGKFFRNYIALILKRCNKARYLSKNNNNILRLRAVRGAFPSALILIPFRDPVQQAYSLFRQHLRFSEIHRNDRFTQRYMGWLVHHEFGSDHRPFDWGIDNTKGQGPDTPDYWLGQWCNAYSSLLREISHVGGQAIFFPFDDFCEDPDRVMGGLQQILGLEKVSVADISKPAIVSPDIGDDSLLVASREIYAELKKQAEDHFPRSAV